jgi:hypothetical protein
VTLHPGVVRTTATLWGHPHDILRGVFDVAGFAVYAILSVDLQPFPTRFVRHKLIHTRGAVAAFGTAIGCQVERNRDVVIAQCEVGRLVFFVVGVADEHAT